MTDTETDVDVVELASGLRFAVARLHRLLRQQDQSGLAPALATALATINREGPLTLSQLAAQEQVTPPTITKLVDRLEERGLATRHPDATDKRVCRVQITAEGRSQLESIRIHRTEWLAARLGDLPLTDLSRLAGALDVLEGLLAPNPQPSRPQGPTTP